MIRDYTLTLWRDGRHVDRYGETVRAFDLDKQGDHATDRDVLLRWLLRDGIRFDGGNPARDLHLYELRIVPVDDPRATPRVFRAAAEEGEDR